MGNNINNNNNNKNNNNNLSLIKNNIKNDSLFENINTNILNLNKSINEYFNNNFNSKIFNENHNFNKIKNSKINSLFKKNEINFILETIEISSFVLISNLNCENNLFFLLNNRLEKNLGEIDFKTYENEFTFKINNKIDNENKIVYEKYINNLNEIENENLNDKIKENFLISENNININFINNINYKIDKSNFIVTSYMPSTTLNVISIQINEDLTLLDTPGILNEGNIVTHLSEDVVKEINIKHEIKPRIYQATEKTSLILDKIGRINILSDSNISIYISNNIDIDKANYSNNKKYTDLELTKIKVKENEDLVIEGLCFIKVSNTTLFEVYMPSDVDIYTREKII